MKCAVCGWYPVVGVAFRSFPLGIQVFWNVHNVAGWVDPDILKDCSVFETSEATEPATQHHIAEDLYPQLHH